VKGKPQTAITQPWDARINASVCEFGIEMGQDRCGSRLSVPKIHRKQ
jgi:hypothetical protein